MNIGTLISSAFGPRIAELHHEVAFEVWQRKWTKVSVHAMRIESADLLPIEAYFDRAGNVWTRRLHQNSATSVFGEGKSEIAAMVGGCDLSLKLPPMSCIQRDRVVVGSRYLIGARELELACFGSGFDLVYFRHDGYIPEVSHPDRGLMSSDESRNGRVVIVIGSDTDLVLPS